MSDRRYIYVTLHIVGTVDDWTTEYSTDRRAFATDGAARRHGLRRLDHDDFWVCEMRGRELQRILHSDLEPRPLDEEEFEQVRRALGGAVVERRSSVVPIPRREESA